MDTNWRTKRGCGLFSYKVKEVINTIELDPQVIVILGLFAGVLGRTLLPYLWALKRAIDAGQTLPWDWKYAITGFVGFLISMLFSAIVTVLLYPTALEVVINQVPNAGGPLLFSAAFGWGWTANDVINELMKAPATPSKPPT